MEGKEKWYQDPLGIILVAHLAFFIGLLVGGSITKEGCIAYEEPYKIRVRFLI